MPAYPSRRPFFRLQGALLQTKIEHFDQALQEQADELAAGEFVVVARGNIRVASNWVVKQTDG